MPKYVVQNSEYRALMLARKIARWVWAKNRVRGNALPDSDREEGGNLAMYHIVNRHPQTIPLMPTNGSPLSYKSSRTNLDILHDMIFDTVIHEAELRIECITRKYFLGLYDCLKRSKIDYNVLRECLAPRSQVAADAQRRLALAQKVQDTDSSAGLGVLETGIAYERGEKEEEQKEPDAFSAEYAVLVQASEKNHSNERQSILPEASQPVLFFNHDSPESIPTNSGQLKHT